jgi:hypothetical protein
MALYVGEAVRIRSQALDPQTDEPLDPAPTSGVVDFWEPGKNPKTDATVRANPDYQNATMTYRATQDDFVLDQDTTGWPVGKWTFRVTMTGSTFTNWEYGTFALKEG